jgi:hypothetical protein
VPHDAKSLSKIQSDSWSEVTEIRNHPGEGYSDPILLPFGAADLPFYSRETSKGSSFSSKIYRLATPFQPER